MKIQFFSDIHLEFYTNKVEINNIVSKIEKCADICVIAGDIGYPFHFSYAFFLESISKIFKHVIIIHGNHEYYQLTESQKDKTMKDIKEKTREICINLSNVHFLDNSYIDIIDEDEDNNGTIYRFIGSVLWSYIYMPQYLVNDKYNIEEYTVENNNKWFKTNVDYLETILRETEEQNKNQNENKNIICVVITHHLPSFHLIHEKYKHDYKYNQCFASSSDRLIKSPVKAWIFGHTHMKINKKINDVMCVANPIGYPGENDDSEINFNETITITF